MPDDATPRWYVAVEEPGTLTPPGRRTVRATKTFHSEEEAKEFARAKCAEGLKVNAGTINPHWPKRAIPSTEVFRWLEEPRARRHLSVAPKQT
jgi:hypothetical protein